MNNRRPPLKIYEKRDILAAPAYVTLWQNHSGDDPERNPFRAGDLRNVGPPVSFLAAEPGELAFEQRYSICALLRRAREGVVVRNRVICVLSIVALIVLAGCGSPSSTPTATSAPSPEPPAATTPASAPPAPADEPSSSPPGTAAPAQPAPVQPAAADESPPPPPDTAATAAGGVLSEGDSPLAVLVRLLAALPLATENSADYDRGDYEHDRAYLCDTSGVDPYTGSRSTRQIVT